MLHGKKLDSRLRGNDKEKEKKRMDSRLRGNDTEKTSQLINQSTS